MSEEIQLNAQQWGVLVDHELERAKDQIEMMQAALQRVSENPIESSTIAQAVEFVSDRSVSALESLDRASKFADMADVTTPDAAKKLHFSRVDDLEEDAHLLTGEDRMSIFDHVFELKKFRKDH